MLCVENMTCTYEFEVNAIHRNMSATRGDYNSMRFSDKCQQQLSNQINFQNFQNFSHFQNQSCQLCENKVEKNPLHEILVS